jgi:hypothetical protein
MDIGNATPPSRLHQAMSSNARNRLNRHRALDASPTRLPHYLLGGSRKALAVPTSLRTRLLPLALDDPHPL